MTSEYDLTKAAWSAWGRSILVNPECPGWTGPGRTHATAKPEKKAARKRVEKARRKNRSHK